MSRPLLLDGITIQLVGELLFELGSELPDRHNAAQLYRIALEDFAFAVVFGSTLGRLGSLPARNGVYPGREVLAYDGRHLFTHELPDAESPVETVLMNSSDRNVIADDLCLLLDTFPTAEGLWGPYLRQEATAYLPSEPMLSSTPELGVKYVFPKKREGYFHDSSLQQVIPAQFVSALVTSLREWDCRQPCE